MIDEVVFMEKLGSINPKPCVFGKVILARLGACSLVIKHYAAEREMVSCRSDPHHEQCAQLLDSMRQNSAFALKLTHITPPLPHGPEMRVQCGGLQGLQREVDGGEQISDIALLVKASMNMFGSLDALPYSRLVQSIVACEPRKKRPLPD